MSLPIKQVLPLRLGEMAAARLVAAGSLCMCTNIRQLLAVLLSDILASVLLCKHCPCERAAASEHHTKLQAYMLLSSAWCRANSPEERLQEALRNQDAVTACIQQKHFAKSLQSSQLTQPAQLLCGIAESGYVHFMFVYKDPMRDVGYDNDISLSYCLPVRED